MTAPVGEKSLNNSHKIESENYFKKTGEVVLINTSFNNHEEPIVESPLDAIKSMSIKNVDNVIFNSSILI